MTSDAPFFLVGAPRSGTTLLRYMLCSHPRIYVPPESNFIPRFFRRDPVGPLAAERALAILSTIGGYKPFWRDWRGEPLDPVTLVDGLDPITPASLIDALYRAYADRFGAARWGDKSPMYASHVDVLTSMFPTAKIVHIVRDARDVTASSLAAYRGARFFYVDPYYVARTWRRRVEDAARSGAELTADRYHRLRYEDLTSDPEGQLRAICRFLGESYEPSMATPDREARRHHHSSGIHVGVRNPVTPARAGRWRTDLEPRDARLVQSLTGPTLVSYGYRLEDLGSVELRERPRIAALWAKYRIVDAGRRAVASTGLFHPTRLLALGRDRRSALRRIARDDTSAGTERGTGGDATVTASPDARLGGG